jgi:hypothetical protein
VELFAGQNRHDVSPCPLYLGVWSGYVKYNIAFRIDNRKDRQTWRKLQKKIWADKGIISFSSKWSSPLLWAHYADSHQGLCLGFDINPDIAFEVSYSADLEAIPTLSEILACKDGSVFERSTRTKYDHWAYESEWRVFLRVSEPDPVTNFYFEPFSDNIHLREVIIGARSTITSDRIRKIAPVDIKIQTARLAFSKFEVTQQKAKLLQK